MKLLTILFFVLQISYAFSQDISPKLKQEIDSLLNLSRSGMIEVNLKSTLTNGLKALKKSNQLNYSEGIAKSNYYIANSLFTIGEYKKALDFLSNALKEDYSQSNPILMYDIHRVRGRIYGNLEMNQLAIVEFQKGNHFIEKVIIEKNKKYLENLYNENMSHIYFKLDKLDSSRYFLDKNHELFKSQKEEFVFNNKINHYTSLAEIYIEKRQNDSAVWALKRALDLADKYKYPYKSSIYKNWGDIHNNKSNPDSAIFYYNKAIENIKETNIESELPSIYERLTLIYKDLKNHKEFQYYSIELINTKEKLLKQKMEAGDAAIKILLSETTNQNSKANYWLISILTLSTIILLVATIYLVRRYKKAKIRMANKRQIIAENEKILFQKEQETKELKLKLNDAFEEVITLAKENNPQFLTRFSEVYDEFYLKLTSIEPKLIKTEIKFCMLLFLNFSTKDIAEYTFVTVKAVQHSRFRLRKKLNIPSEADIIEWINEKY